MDPNLPTGETLSDGDDSGAESNVTLPASAFAETPKDGERLMFCVTGSDGESVTGYWMAAEAEEPEESWEDAARNSIKPPEET